jgi:dipeptidyl aminopeptidase/acylaminoacyl peptidase
MAFLAAVGLHAEPAPSPPAPALDAYGRLPALELTRLSPSGTLLAMITVAHDQRSLVVRETGGRALLLMPVGAVKVRTLRWVGEDHVLVGVSRTQQLNNTISRAEYPFTLAINVRTGKSLPVLFKADHMLPYTFGYYGGFEDKGHAYGLFLASPVSGARGFDSYLTDDEHIYRVDLDTDAFEIAVRGHGRGEGWVLGPDHRPIAHGEYEQGVGSWRLMAESPAGTELLRVKDPLWEYQIVGAGRAPGTVIVDHGDIDEWTLATGQVTRLDVGGEVATFAYDSTEQRLDMVLVAGDQLTPRFFDDKLAARFNAVRKAIPGRMWPVTWSDDFARMIVYAEGDNDAGTYWLIDGKSAGPLGYAYPDLPDAVVGKVSVVTYRAADGLEIHAILTLPPGREARALPLVVLPHGGPQAHDTVSFDWWAQAYASRGYAVLQPNFRGSTGYGRDFRDAGFGQWGRKMQTDLSDGVAALAAQGVIDRRRVCIVGASYGGYAALAGVTVQHGLYRCAVSVAGVSDLAYLISNNLWENGQQEGTAGVRYLNRFLGVTSQDDRGLNEISPVRLAARADAPILLIHGLDDTVVPVRQSRDMEAALARAGKPVEFLQLPGEDHWLSSETTRKAMLQAAVRFVERYNPPE